MMNGWHMKWMNAQCWNGVGWRIKELRKMDVVSVPENASPQIAARER